MYFVQTRTGQIKSAHITAIGARKGVDKVLKADREGIAVFISKVEPVTYLAPLVTVLCMVTVGVMLAWRG
jgi:hypothetical protein